MMKYEAILFDFDGTLADSNPAIYQAYLSTFQHFNSNKDYSHIENIMNQHLSYKETFKAVFYTDDINQEIDNYLQKIYSEIASSKTQLFQGVHEIIKKIETLSCPWGIVTSKKRAFVEQIIEATGLSKGYACLICEEDVKCHKPHPESLLKACQLLGKEAQKIAYVGDALTDIQAARACGMDSIAVSYGYGFNAFGAPSTWGATYVISDLNELAHIVSNTTPIFASLNTSPIPVIKNHHAELAELEY